MPHVMNGILPSSQGASEPADDSDLDLSAVWDLSPAPTLVVSPSYCIRRASNGVLNAWDRKRHELIGQDLFDFLYNDSPLERFDRIPLVRAIEVTISSRKPNLCPGAYRIQDESWSARITPVFKEDKLLLFLLEWDPDDNRPQVTGCESTPGLRSVDEMFRLLVQSVKDYAIFLLDTRGYVTTWNTGAELLKGFNREDIIGKHFSTFYGEDDLRAGKPEGELMTCLRNGTVEDEGWRYRKDGSKFWANVVITAVYRNGVHIGFGKVTRDLTERREGELRLITAYEESSTLKNDFLANISHEIRTPMHGLLSANGLLVDSPLTEDQREIANIITESGQVLLEVINGILDYSKLTSGKFPINLDVFSVGRIVSSVVRNVQTTLLPGVHLRLKFASNLPKLALGDQLRFRQILQNVADNAAKFTEDGYISVYTSVLAEDDATYTILTDVTDTGIGIENDASQELFKPFMQFEKSIKKRFQGTGLGLTIAKSLAELMGGQMGYRPNPDCQGSIFWFSVQLKKIASSENHIAVNGQTTIGTPIDHVVVQKQNSGVALKRLQEVGSMKQVLAVEDNIINQKVLVGMLHAFGLKNVSVAPDGAQAVSMLNSSPDKYDLVLMDVSMPVMDGFEATTKIRESGLQVPIIAMTANALQGYREKCLDSGMDDYIPKPVSKKLLLQKILLWIDPVKESHTRLEEAARSQRKRPICPSEICKAG